MNGDHPTHTAGARAVSDSSAGDHGLGTLVGMLRAARGPGEAIGVDGPPTAAVHPDAPVRSPLPERYEDRGLLRHGGMGEVRLALDRALSRTVAIKLLHWDHIDSPRTRARFEHEARVTAALQHPGVVPILDRGVLPGGRPWFVMQEVRGETLATLLRHIYSDACEDVRERVRQLLTALLRMAETLAYAHSRGVVHRDIKPSNLMLGEFGEALVMDWGIARWVGDAEPSRADGGYRAERDDEPLTREGDLLGTLAYLSPEQARGAEVGFASDVFSFGLVLFEVLTGQKAYGNGPADLMRRMLPMAEPVLARRLSERSVISSEELAAVVEQATRVDPKARLANGAALAERLRRWLDGDVRRRRARALVARSGERSARLDAVRERLAESEQELRQLAGEVRSHDPVQRKRPLWALQDRVAELRRRAETEEARLVEELRLALQHDPDLEEARSSLVAVAMAGLQDAEHTGRGSAARRWRQVVMSHGTEADRRGLAQPARLQLVLDEPSEVTIHRYVTVDRRWALEERPVLSERRETGRVETSLAPGRYLATVTRGASSIRLPLFLHRGELSSEADPLRPFAGLELDRDDVPVAAGWATVGGDEWAIEPLPPGRMWVGPFIVRRFPVTNDEYLAFLNDCVASGRSAEAADHVPRLQEAATTEGAAFPAFGLDSRGRYVLMPDELGRQVEGDWPVALVSWHSARAYAAWYARRTGRPWRLPSEVEWEKAARGVDGRHFPWGDEPEITWARVMGSTDGVPGREGVHGHPIDESPYGVRGMAGNVRDWCREQWTVVGPRGGGGDEPSVLRIGPAPTGSAERVVRGGGWNATVHEARAAARFAAKPTARFPVVGFRLAHSVDDEGLAPDQGLLVSS